MTAHFPMTDNMIFIVQDLFKQRIFRTCATLKKDP